MVHRSKPAKPGNDGDPVEGEIVTAEAAAIAPWQPTGRLANLATAPNPEDRMSAEAIELIRDGTPAKTRETYNFQWAKFIKWCGQTNRDALPATPATIVEWILELGRREGRYGRPTAPDTVALSLAVIAVAHRRARRPEVDGRGNHQYGYVPPTTHPDVHKAFGGYTDRWLKAGHRPDLAHPITRDELRRMIATLDTRSLAGLRDAVALALGYGMGARQSELFAVQLHDVTVHEDRLDVRVPMSKTDQRGQGDVVYVLRYADEWADICPTRLIPRWLAAMHESEFTTGPLLRAVHVSGPTPKDGRPRKGRILPGPLGREKFDHIIKSTGRAAGLPEDLHLSSHGLRAGAATEAALEGADTPELNEYFRWSLSGNTANRYVRRTNRRSPRGNAMARVFGYQPSEPDETASAGE